MNKVFNRLQTLKSIENCDKFSKSVSYETLVGGTATTGTDIKQTQRLFSSCADKPLTAVGTLTSLLCNSAKVVEKWLQIPPVLRLVKVLGLVAVLSAVIISESRAGVPDGCIGAKYEGCSGSGYSCTSCVEGYELVSNCWYKTCQKGCNSDEERINGSCTRKCAANEERINGSCTRKCAANEERINGSCIRKCAANEIKVNGTCTTPPACTNGGGYKCLRSTGAVVDNCCYKTEGDTTTMYPEDNTKGFEAYAFSQSNKNLIISDGAIKIYGYNSFDTMYIGENSSFAGGWCANNFSKLSHIVISDNVSGLTYDCGSYRGDIVCLGDIDECKSSVGQLANRVVAPTESQCNGSGTYGWNGVGCAKKDSEGKVPCASGFVEWDNACVDEYPFAKKRWTPAEAAQWLHDGNDNFVVITFKK